MEWKPRQRPQHPYVVDEEEERRMVAFMVQHPRRFLTRIGSFSPDVAHYVFDVPYRRAATLARRAKVIHDRRQLRLTRNQAQEPRPDPSPVPNTSEAAAGPPNPPEASSAAKPKVPPGWSDRFLA